MDHLLQETKRIRPLTNQVAYNTFIEHGRGQCALPTGPKVILIHLILENPEVFVVPKVMTSTWRNTAVGDNKIRNHTQDLSKRQSPKTFLLLPV